METVTHFHDLLDAHHGVLGMTFARFPCGCCGDASELLAAYLKDHGHGDFALVSGRCEEQSHAWLEGAGLIIDITVSQFGDLPLITVDRKWHEKFAHYQCRREVGSSWRSEGIPHLVAAYSTLCQFDSQQH